MPTSNPIRFSALGWVIVLVVTGAFLFWIDGVWIGRVKEVSALGQTTASGAPATIEVKTAPGVVAHRLIVPEHNVVSYHWIAQTEQMFARGEWRVRRIDYENAPNGHDVRAASPYRWWLGFVAWVGHAMTGKSVMESVEHASLYAGPALHFLVLVIAAAFVAWRFGAMAATLLSLGLVAIYPFATEFLPGAPDDRGLAHAFALGSVLAALAGVGRLFGFSPRNSVEADANTSGERARTWFILAGVVGGIGLWINPLVEAAAIGGIAVGALVVAWVARRESAKPSGELSPHVPWMTWAISGAATSLAAYAIEYAPAHLLSWKLRYNHPFYALAWLGVGLLLAPLTAWISGKKPRWNFRIIGGMVLGVAAIAAIPVMTWTMDAAGFATVDAPSFRLTNLWDGAVASSLSAWIDRAGLRPAAMVTLVPLVLLGPVAWVFFTADLKPGVRAMLALALGPVMVALCFSWRPLGIWSGFDVAMLAMVVAATVAVTTSAATNAVLRWLWMGFAAVVLTVGALQFLPPRDADGRTALTSLELDGLIDRDLGTWLAGHIGKQGGVILAPPEETTSLFFYAGLRGLGTLAWENRGGLEVAVRITSASTPEESKELIEKRGVTHIVMPSWDPYLDVYARMGMGQVQGTFQERINNWRIPPWLRPIPYQLPNLRGYESRWVTVFEVVEDQEDAPALSRTAEYFLEMGQFPSAVSVAQDLRRFPADLGALVARALVEKDHADAATFAKTAESLLARLNARGDRYLPWDRRVSLAAILTRMGKDDLARAQIKRCMADVDEAKLRTLTTGSLYRLLFLGKHYETPIESPELQALALGLLPPEARARLQK